MHEATALSGYFKKLEETHRAVEVLRPAWNQKQAVFVLVQLFFQVYCKYFCDNNGFKELY
jgi:hypothetical protein